jgi:hypothetical protein
MLRESAAFHWRKKPMKSDFYPIHFAVPAASAARLYDCVVAQNREATPESLDHALTELFIRQPDVLAGYFRHSHHVHNA